MFKSHRCQICGETYLGEEKPDRCPFCGAGNTHLVAPAEWVRHGAVEMSDQSYEDCERAVELELKNTAFYRCAAENTDSQIMESFFKRLASQESEHAELLCEMMGIDEPEMPAESCFETDQDNMQEANQREGRAMRFYQDVAERAEEPRVEQVFRALSDIESEHLKVSSIYK